MTVTEEAQQDTDDLMDWVFGPEMIVRVIVNISIMHNSLSYPL